MSRDDRKRKSERKARNKAARERGFDHIADPRNRWQGSVTFQFGKDPRTRATFAWSGVKVAVEAFGEIEGVVELTAFALAGDRADVN